MFKKENPIQHSLAEGQEIDPNTITQFREYLVDKVKTTFRK